MQGVRSRRIPIGGKDRVSYEFRRELSRRSPSRPRRYRSSRARPGVTSRAMRRTPIQKRGVGPAVDWKLNCAVSTAAPGAYFPPHDEELIAARERAMSLSSRSSSGGTWRRASWMVRRGRRGRHDMTRDVFCALTAVSPASGPGARRVWRRSRQRNQERYRSGRLRRFRAAATDSIATGVEKPRARGPSEGRRVAAVGARSPEEDSPGVPAAVVCGNGGMELRGDRGIAELPSER